MKYLALLLLASLCATPLLAASPAKTVTLTDYVGVAWADELVHETLTFAPGVLKGVAAARVEIGKAAILSQISDVVRHEDGSVKSMNVWFMASVPAYGAVTYTITPGKAGAVSAGVAVKTTADTVELTTSAPTPIGIRLLNGSKSFNWPAPAADVPGPIRGLLLPSGRVTGSGQLQVPFHVRGITTELTATGPLFAEAKVRYQFNEGYWTLTARVVAGSPLVTITEDFDTGWNAQNGFELDRFYTFTVNGNGFAPTQAFYLSRNDKPEYQNLLPPTSQDIISTVMWQPTTSGTLCCGYTPTTPTAGVQDYGLIAWPCWANRVGVGIRYIEPEKDAIGFVALDTQYWRNQMAIRFRREANGAITANLPLQVYEQEWDIDGYGRHSPNATGKTLDVPEMTARRKWGITLTTPEDETKGKLISLLNTSAKAGAWPLDTVKEWTLDWPDPMAKATWAPESSKPAKDLMAQVDKWITAKRAFGNFGVFSMHDYFLVSIWPLKNKGLADLKTILNDPAQLSAADRQRLRRQTAYIAYVMHSPQVFPWGSGSHLGNPNMSIMEMQTRSFCSALIADHPMVRPWGQWTSAFVRNYIERFVNDAGAFYECPSYTFVTLSELIESNDVMVANGLDDALNTKRFADGIRFTLNWLLPTDLRFNGLRTIVPIGNTSYQSIMPDFNAKAVDYFKTRNPELAGQLAWAINQTLPADKRLTQVKEVVPDLKSVWFKDYGVVMRHGFGTPYETCFFMMAGNNLGHYETTDHMVYTLYAKGQPINLHFGNGYFPSLQRPWLRNGVSVDHRTLGGYERLYATVQTATFQPATEYLHASWDADELLPRWPEQPLGYGKPDPTPWQPRESMPLMTWHRQVLFVKDDDPKGPNYFVVRDSFSGKPSKPTDDNFWFLATGMTRQDNVFHFDGQLPVDMDVFVNTPARPEVETDKFGHVQQPYYRLTGDNLNYYPNKTRREDQLCLRLKQPAGGGYCVVLYPRLKGIDPAAAYTTLGESAVKVETPLSTDYLLLDAFPVTAKADGIEMTGTSVAVRKYKAGKIVVTNGEGAATVRAAGKTITGTGAFSVTITGDKVETKTYAVGAKVDVQ
ncbi:MAG: hypothetical protein ACYDBB_17290 [Armatimonadota bacterium]